jgi:hypothetical protein
MDHGSSAGPWVHRGLGRMLVAELTRAHTPERLRPWGLMAVGENEEGARGIITVSSEGGGAMRFGPTAGRRRQRPVVLDVEELRVQRRRNEHWFGNGGRKGCSWAAFIVLWRLIEAVGRPNDDDQSWRSFKASVLPVSGAMRQRSGMIQCGRGAEASGWLGIVFTWCSGYRRGVAWRRQSAKAAALVGARGWWVEWAS